MKFLIHPSEFHAAWKRISSIPPVRSPLDDYKAVIIQTPGDGKISLSATNGEVFGVSQGKADIDTPAKAPVMVPADQFAKVAASIKDLMVRFQLTGNVLTVSSGGWELKLPTVSKELFRPAIGEHKKARIQVESLLHGLKAARGALGKASDFNYELAVIDYDHPAMVVGLDGRQMAGHQLMMLDEGENRGGVKIGVTAVDAMLKFFAAEEGAINTQYDANNAVFYTPDCAIYIRLSEGRVMNWRKGLTASAPKAWAKVLQSELADAVKVASIACDVTSPEGVGIRVRVSEDSIDMTAESAKYGSGRSHLPCTCEDSFTKFECYLAADRFLKAVSQFDSPTLSIGSANPEQSVAFSDGVLTWLLAVLE